MTAVSVANFRSIRGTGMIFILVPLIDLKFLDRACSTRCRNFKSAARAT
jgi:hypothetical protein